MTRPSPPKYSIFGGVVTGNLRVVTPATIFAKGKIWAGKVRIAKFLRTFVFEI